MGVVFRPTVGAKYPRPRTSFRSSVINSFCLGAGMAAALALLLGVEAGVVRLAKTPQADRLACTIMDNCP